VNYFPHNSNTSGQFSVSNLSNGKPTKLFKVTIDFSLLLKYLSKSVMRCAILYNILTEPICSISKNFGKLETKARFICLFDYRHQDLFSILSFDSCIVQENNFEAVVIVKT